MSHRWHVWTKCAMITQISSTDRITVASATLLAMRGFLSDARELFRNASEKALTEGRSLDYTWLRMGLAEVLYLDCREEEAQSLFGNEIDCVLSDVPSPVKLIVDLNKTPVGLASLDPEPLGSFID